MQENSKDNTHTPYRVHLNRLPEVFTIAEFRRVLGFNDNTARVCLTRWTQRGLIEPWAPRSGVYFNLVVNRRAKDECFAKAILMRFPFATLTGVDVLTQRGWVTQSSNTSTIAVATPPQRGSTLKGDGYPQVEHAQFVYRPRKWWLACNADRASMTAEEKESIRGLTPVSPGFALVDMWLHRHEAWFPDPDDLYAHEYANAQAGIERACALLGVKFDEFCASSGFQFGEQLSFSSMS